MKNLLEKIKEKIILCHLQLNHDQTRYDIKRGIEDLFKNDKVFDYYVQCDDKNNTPDVIDLNQLAVTTHIKEKIGDPLLKFKFLYENTTGYLFKPPTTKDVKCKQVT